MIILCNNSKELKMYHTRVSRIPSSRHQGALLPQLCSLSIESIHHQQRLDSSPTYPIYSNLSLKILLILSGSGVITQTPSWNENYFI